MLDDMAVLQNENVIGSFHSGQTVSDDDSSPSFQQPVDGPFDEHLGGRVEP